MKSPPWQNKSREHVRRASFCMGCISPSSTASLEITSITRRNASLIDLTPDTAGLAAPPCWARLRVSPARRPVVTARGFGAALGPGAGTGQAGRAGQDRCGTHLPRSQAPRHRARRRPALSLPTPGGSSRRGGAGAAGPLLPPGPRGAMRAGPTRPAPPAPWGRRLSGTLWGRGKPFLPSPSYPALPSQPCLASLA